ncbi:hypothetical protein [Corallococcus exercitus]|uniref:Uncharacterized protein n=1 Tax=Corallococcus exercitus TaxID=2316736 RepID=A0A7Y4K052_9BACT|nr:hypothetical protein [Corallococcus exercitus]NOK13487.1 hypothetical protein [Corallococcus exercitus]
MLENDKGEELATQPHDVNLDCAEDKECGLTVSAGAASDANAVHVSSELVAAVTKLNKKHGEGGYDLVQEVSRNFPAPPGETNPCSCNWESTRTRTPTTQSILPRIRAAASLAGTGRVPSTR